MAGASHVADALSCGASFTAAIGAEHFKEGGEQEVMETGCLAMIGDGSIVEGRFHLGWFQWQLRGNGAFSFTCWWWKGLCKVKWLRSYIVHGVTVSHQLQHGQSHTLDLLPSFLSEGLYYSAGRLLCFGHYRVPNIRRTNPFLQLAGSA